MFRCIEKSTEIREDRTADTEFLRQANWEAYLHGADGIGLAANGVRGAIGLSVGNLALHARANAGAGKAAEAFTAFKETIKDGSVFSPSQSCTRLCPSAS